MSASSAAERSCASATVSIEDAAADQYVAFKGSDLDMAREAPPEPELSKGDSTFGGGGDTFCADNNIFGGSGSALGGSCNRSARICANGTSHGSHGSDEEIEVFGTGVDHATNLDDGGGDVLLDERDDEALLDERAREYDNAPSKVADVEGCTSFGRSNMASFDCVAEAGELPSEELSGRETTVETSGTPSVPSAKSLHASIVPQAPESGNCADDVKCSSSAATVDVGPPHVDACTSSHLRLDGISPTADEYSVADSTATNLEAVTPTPDEYSVSQLQTDADGNAPYAYRLEAVTPTPNEYSVSNPQTYTEGNAPDTLEGVTSTPSEYSVTESKTSGDDNAGTGLELNDGTRCVVFDESAVDRVKPSTHRARALVVDFDTHFYEVEHIGGGNFSEVFRTSLNGESVLFKVAKNASAHIEVFEEMQRFQSLYPHPNVLPFLGICRNFRHEQFANKLKTDAIVVPFCEFGSLRSFIHKFPEVFRSEETLLNIALGMIRGVIALHDHNMIHRDIKCDNFVVSSAGRVEMCDFGLSRHVPIFDSGIDDKDAELSLETAGGFLAWRYSAPESLEGQKFSAKSDVWMYGIALVELITRGRPFPQIKNVGQLQEELKNGVEFILKQVEDVKLQVPETLITIIKDCCQMDPAKRKSAEAISNVLQTRMRDMRRPARIAEILRASVRGECPHGSGEYLQPLKLPGYRVCCAICDCYIFPRSPMYGCRICDYYVCRKCFDKGLLEDDDQPILWTRPVMERLCIFNSLSLLLQKETYDEERDWPELTARFAGLVTRTQWCNILSDIHECSPDTEKFPNKFANVDIIFLLIVWTTTLFEAAIDPAAHPPDLSCTHTSITLVGIFWILPKHPRPLHKIDTLDLRFLILVCVAFVFQLSIDVFEERSILESVGLYGYLPVIFCVSFSIIFRVYSDPITQDICYCMYPMIPSLFLIIVPMKAIRATVSFDFTFLVCSVLHVCIMLLNVFVLTHIFKTNLSFEAIRDSKKEQMQICFDRLMDAHPGLVVMLAPQTPMKPFGILRDFVFTRKIVVNILLSKRVSDR